MTSIQSSITFRSSLTPIRLWGGAWILRGLLPILLTLVAIAANAQGSFLDNLRKVEAGKGTVTVQQDAAIDKLVNAIPVTTPQTSAQTTAAGSSTPSSSNTAAKPSDHKPQNHDSANNSDSQKHSSKVSAKAETETSDTLTVIDTRKKVMRNSYKTTGYRIQIYSGGNSRAARQKAEQAGNAMKAHFPYEPIYVHFYSPSWKCRMGNYRELSEAQQVLAQVRALGYTQACIVKGTITVAY